MRIYGGLGNFASVTLNVFILAVCAVSYLVRPHHLREFGAYIIAHQYDRYIKFIWPNKQVNYINPGDVFLSRVNSEHNRTLDEIAYTLTIKNEGQYTNLTLVHMILS